MIPGVPQAQADQDLADHVIILDKGDHAHPAVTSDCMFISGLITGKKCD